MHVETANRNTLRQAVLDLSRSHPNLEVEQVLTEESRAVALIQESKGASLLVMGTRLREASAGAALGSEGRDVLLHSLVPVCVVPLVDSAT
jgi:nucleotide-binding universal stress UspA family protein